MDSKVSVCIEYPKRTNNIPRGLYDAGNILKPLSCAHHFFDAGVYNDNLFWPKVRAPEIAAIRIRCRWRRARWWRCRGRDGAVLDLQELRNTPRRPARNLVNLAIRVVT